jgi:hypothetical protein
MNINRKLLIASWALAAAVGAVPALGAGAASPAQVQTGLAATLADDDKLLGELAARQLNGLLEYVFDKKQISGDQRQAYLAAATMEIIASKPNLSAREREEAMAIVSSSIDRILATVRNEEELANLAARLVDIGTRNDVNLLEYWGEDPRVQSRLRPITEAIAKVYARAIAAAEARVEQITAQIGREVTPQLENAYNRAESLVLVGQYSSGFNQYMLALSIDRADPARIAAARRGIELLEEFDDIETYQELAIRAQVGIGKLHMVQGNRDALEKAREFFKRVIDNGDAPWEMRFEAVYFAAVTDLMSRDVKRAEAGLANVTRWLAANAPASDAHKRGTDAAVEMLRFRIYSMQAELAQGEAAVKANEQAIGVLQALQQNRRDLTGIINQQLIARLPDQPDVTTLNALLLEALIARGYDEVRREDEDRVDKRALQQAMAAARELMTRVGRDNVTHDNAASALMGMGLFQSKLGMDVEAAVSFIEYLEKYPPPNPNARYALDNVKIQLAKLNPGSGSPPDVRAVYERFLDFATGPRAQLREFNLPYAILLVRRNATMIDAASFDDESRKKLILDAGKAVKLLQAVDGQHKLLACYYEMFACEQLVELAPEGPAAAAAMRRIVKLGDEFNGIVAAELAQTTDPAQQARLAAYRMQSTLRVAKMALRDKSASRDASLQQAVKLLADIEPSVKATPSLVPTWLTLRVTALMSLGQAEQALENVRALVEAQGEQSLGIVVSMVDMLRKDFDLARAQGDRARQLELSGNIARLSRYMVELAQSSQNQAVRKFLPDYERFQVNAIMTTASLEQDQDRRQGLLGEALAAYQALLKRNPDDKRLVLDIANVQFEAGDFLRARATYFQFLEKRWLGQGQVQEETDEGPVRRWNDLYWEVMYKMLRSTAELIKQQAAGYDQAMAESTHAQLKRLYIIYQNEPGGPKWLPHFEKLRQEMLPDWTPPVPDASATRPAEDAE